MTLDDPTLRLLAAITVVVALIALGVWLCCGGEEEDQGDLW